MSLGSLATRLAIWQSTKGNLRPKKRELPETLQGDSPKPYPLHVAIFMHGATVLINGGSLQVHGILADVTGNEICVFVTQSG